MRRLEIAMAAEMGVVVDGDGDGGRSGRGWLEIVTVPKPSNVK